MWCYVSWRMAHTHLCDQLGNGVRRSYQQPPLFSYQQINFIKFIESKTIVYQLLSIKKGTESFCSISNKFLAKYSTYLDYCGNFETETYFRRIITIILVQFIWYICQTVLPSVSSELDFMIYIFPKTKFKFIFFCY